MKLGVLLLVIPFLLLACLELTPNVSTDFSEIEARAVFEREIRRVCDHKKSRIPNILAEIDVAEAEPTTDHWIFSVRSQEALVFESGVVSASATSISESCFW